MKRIITFLLFLTAGMSMSLRAADIVNTADVVNTAEVVDEAKVAQVLKTAKAIKARKTAWAARTGKAANTAKPAKAAAAAEKEIYATLSSDGKTMTLYYDDKYGTREGVWDGWNSDNGTFEAFENEDQEQIDIIFGINKVFLDESMHEPKPNSTSCWFYGMVYLKKIEYLDRLYTWRTENMSYMFAECQSLEELNVSNLDADNESPYKYMGGMFQDCYSLRELEFKDYFNAFHVDDMSYMFDGCESLTTIYSKQAFTAKRSESMFEGCINLKGENGTVYDAEHTDASYAHKDEGVENPGYFSTNPRKIYATLSGDGKTMTIYYDNQYGSRDNVLTLWTSNNRLNSPIDAKLKEIVKVVKKVILDVSMKEAKPNYTCRWFCSMEELEEIEHLDYLNTSSVANMAYMFYGCKKLKSLDLSGFNTSLVTDMAHMFHYCESLQSLDLSSFNTERITSNFHEYTGMTCMFAGCKSLTSLDVSSFNTTTVANMSVMFARCESLTTLDLTSFDFSNVKNVTALFDGDIKLQTIYCKDDFSKIPALADSKKIFNSCVKLVGGAGTAYDGAHTDADYAHPDSESNPGYFTPVAESKYPELYGKRSQDGKTLTIYYDKRRPIVDGVTDWSVYNNAYLNEDKETNRITKVVIDKTVKDFTPTTTKEWFSSFRYVKAIVNLEYLNTSEVTNMQNMFYHCDSLVDMSVSSFDTKNVTDMARMFSGCGKLRKLDVSKFNTSNVTDMREMFYGCRNLTSIRCDNFDTQKVTDMSGMFYECEYATPINVSNFDTHNVTDMSYMFAGCRYETHIDVSHFNTENVKTMTGMFTECKSLRSLDLRSFDVSKVTNTQVMFMNDSSLIALYANQDWGTIAPLEWSTGMFYGCPKLKGGAGTVYNESYIDAAYARPDEEGNPGYFTAVAEIYATWDADNTTLTLRYDKNREANGGTTNWAVYNYLATKVVFDPSMKKAEPTSTKDWFYGFSQLETIEHLDYLSTYRVKDMSYMFAGCSSLTTLNVNSFYLSWAETTEGMFSYCINLTTIWCDHNWNEQLYDKNSKDMFLGCTSLVGGKGTAYNANYTSSTRACTDSNLRYGYFTAIPEGAVDLSGNEIYAVLEADNKTLTIRYDKQRISRGGVTDWYKYSSDAGTYHIKAVVIDPSVANAKPLTTEGWFGWFSDLTSITGLEYLNTEYVTDMTNMFRDCSSLTTLDVTTFNTQNVTDMGFMFSGCTSLKTLDLSHFDTRKVSILDNMFEDCESLTELDIRQFETEGVTDMTMLFAGCKNLKALDVTALKTGKVTDMMGMFYRCEKLTELDVSGFDMSSITSLFGMFYGCKSLRTIYCNDDWSKMPSLAYHDDMFTDCPNLAGGNNTTYSASNANDATFAHVDEAGNPGYFTTNLTYQVTLTAENGKIDVEEKDIDLTAVPKGTVLHFTAIPDNGYELASWTGYNGKELVVDDDKTVIANFAVQTFTVRFTDWNDKLIEEQVVEWGKAATAPEDPVREDYLFLGWTPADFSTVYEDMTVKAQYEELIKYFTVTLIAENGKIITDEYIDMTAVEIGTVLLLTAMPDEGYEFDHWSDGNTDNPRYIVVYNDLELSCIFHEIGNGIEEIEQGINSQEQETRKVLRNGELYIILPDGREFDSTGKKIK